MQKLTVEQALRVEDILRSDRGWRRSERIKHARLLLRIAHMGNPDEVPIRRAVIRRLDYDYVDKANSHER